MIIKFTFNDNDFTYILEKFLEHAHFNLKYCLRKYAQNDTAENIKQYCDKTTLFEKYYKMIADEKNFMQNEKNEFISLIKESMIDYIKETVYIDNQKYLLNEIRITVQDKIADKWENGEVVYYLPMHDQYITM